MIDKNKKISNIFKKYGKGKEDGFQTRSTKDLKNERDGIKKGYYAKGVAIFFVTLILVALLKFVTGDYKDVRAQNTSAAKPLTDSIDSGQGEPSLEIMKDQIDSLKNGQNKIQDDYDKKLAKTSSEYQKKIDALSKALEAQKNSVPAPTEVKPSVDPEDVQVLRNELLAEIRNLKNEISEKGHKSEILPQLEETPKVTVSKNKKGQTIIKETYHIGTLGGIGGVEAKKEEKEEVIDFNIVTGLSKALLITGVQAPTFGDGVKNPKPVLVSFNSDILLPNDKRINIKECTGLGSSIGNMNTKRAEITLTKLNCIVEKDGKSYKVEEKVKAYVIGEDGSYGLRGRLVDSGSKIVMRELQVGFLQGVNQAFQTAVQPQFTTSIGSGYGGVPGSYPSSQDVAMSGAAMGGNSGLNALAEYYQKMMDGLYPTISVRAGREVGILWHGGEKINLKATRIFSVTGKGDSRDLDQPFATVASEELQYDEW